MSFQPANPKVVTHRSTQVTNVRNDTFSVYCGRMVTSLGLPRSKWANPFHIGRDGTRQEVIAKYREHLFKAPSLLVQVGELYGHRLGCWCAPLPCHCDLLARLADQVHLSGIPASQAATDQVAQGRCIMPGCSSPGLDIYLGTGQPEELICPACHSVYRPALAVFTVDATRSSVVVPS